MLPSEARIAVYERPNGPFEVRLFPLRAPRRGELLVRVRMCTICRSDLHSWSGHRPNPTPGVLGHEILGTVVALGDGLTHDMRGEPLREGDRITWSEYFVPGDSYHASVLDLPQKTPGVEKYGHLAATTEPHHHGGFGQYCYVLPRSWILRVPDELADEEAAPLNCGVATVACIVERAEIAPGGSVVVFGLGLLGLVTAAMARARGARRVVGIDTVPRRRALGQRFGCDVLLDPSTMNVDDLVASVRAACDPAGADAVIEVCGDAGVIPAALRMLRTGGTCVLGGVVNPEAFVTIDAHLVLRQLITLRGVHNYHPRHLVQALEFVCANRGRFPLGALVDGRYTLDEVGRAMSDAAERKVLRPAIVP